MYEDIYKHKCIVFEDKQHALFKEVQRHGGELPICFLFCLSAEAAATTVGLKTESPVAIMKKNNSIFLQI